MPRAVRLRPVLLLLLLLLLLFVSFTGMWLQEPRLLQPVVWRRGSCVAGATAATTAATIPAAGLKSRPCSCWCMCCWPSC
jgi:hypothetical protein